MTVDGHPTAQLAIDFSAPAPHVTVRARKRDPETSREAAGALDQQQPKLQRSVAVAVQILKDHGPQDDFGLAEKWADYWPEPFSESLPRKARHWAKEAGKVKHDGYTEHHGRRVRRWRVA